MKCPICSHESTTMQKYCGECGAKFNVEQTGSTAPANFPTFGNYTPPHLAEKILKMRSALEGERKHVTVLFCDIANSTPLAARLGAERMHGVLNAFFGTVLAQVHQFEGTVNQFLGDGLMALFGAPLAYEDHARRAVLAALAIRDEIAAHSAEFTGLPEGLQIRIGLNTGIVVVGKIGDNLRMDFTAIGDTTNVAARLQGLAVPGTVLIGEEVLRHVHHFVEVHPLGVAQLKGKSEPFSLFEVMRALPTRKPDPSTEYDVGPGTLIGRESEASAVTHALELLSQGQGGILHIIGDAGIGKSRLLDAARDIARGKPVTWAQGSSVSFGKTLSYLPFQELLRNCFGITRDADGTDKLHKLRAGLLPLFGRETDEILPYVATLLSLTVSGAHGEQVKALDGMAVGHQIFRTCLQLFDRLARSKPLVLALEDWHWADDSSIALFNHLLSLAPKVPILFIVTSRPDSSGVTSSQWQELESDEQLKLLYQPVALTPLSNTASRTLIARVLDGGHLPKNVEEGLLLRASGNPFYLGELVRTLVAVHAIERDEETGAWKGNDRIDTIPLPDTIEGVILARVDRLEDDAKQLLKTASVVGRSFLYRVLHALNQGQASLDADIAKLKSADMVEEKHQLPELELMFKHPLIQQATYESLLDERRRRLHLQVGQCIENLFATRLEEFYSVLAHHFAEAEDWGKAQEYLFMAGEQAGRIAADAEAMEHYEKALAASSTTAGALDPVRRAELDSRMGEALFRMGRHAAALDHLHAALSRLGLPDPTSRGLPNAAIALKLAGRICRRILSPALRIFMSRNKTPDDAVSSLTTQILVTIININYYQDPMRFSLGALTLMDQTEGRMNSRAHVIATSAFGMICDEIGFYRIAGNSHARAFVLAKDLNDDLTLSYCYLMRGIHEYSIGQWPAAEKSFLAAEMGFNAVGHLRNWASARALGMRLLRSKGDPAWMRGIDKYMKIAVDASDEQMKGWATYWIADRYSYRGDARLAVKYFEDACAYLEAIPDFAFLAIGLSGWSLGLVHEGQIEKALALLARCRMLVSQYHISGLFAAEKTMNAAAAYLYAAEHALSRNLRQEALRLAKRECQDAMRQARKTKDDSAPEALRLNGIYAWLTGDAASAEKLWKQGIAMGEKIQTKYVLAKLHDELGSRMGLPDHVEMANTLYVESGAARLNFYRGKTAEHEWVAGQARPFREDFQEETVASVNSIAA